MHKLSLTLTAAALVLATMAISANAQTQLRGAADLRALTYTPITKAACGGWGPYCPPGTTRRCGPYRCWCARCW